MLIYILGALEFTANIAAIEYICIGRLRNIFKQALNHTNSCTLAAYSFDMSKEKYLYKIRIG